MLLLIIESSGCRWSAKSDAREWARARRRHMMVWCAESATRWKIIHSCTCWIRRRKVCVLLMVKWCIIWLKQWNGIWTLQKWFFDDGRSVKHRGLELWVWTPMPITFIYYMYILWKFIASAFSLKSFSHIDLDHQTPHKATLSLTLILEYLWKHILSSSHSIHILQYNMYAFLRILRGIFPFVLHHHIVHIKSCVVHYVHLCDLW